MPVPQPLRVIGPSILPRKPVRAISATSASISTHLADPHLAADPAVDRAGLGLGVPSFVRATGATSLSMAGHAEGWVRSYDAAGKPVFVLQPAFVLLGTFATPEERFNLNFPTMATTHLLRKPPLVCSGSRSYGSYTKTKSGVWVPTSIVAKPTLFDDFKSFVKKQWQTADPRFKKFILKLFGKGLLLAMTGGGVTMLLASLSVRMNNLEGKVDESVKELKIGVADLKAQVAQQSESSHQHEYESHAMYQKLQAEVNEMTGLKDIWLANWFKISGGVTGPVVATEEGTLSRR